MQSITTTQQGDRVRMVVEPRGAWEHSAYQSDNQFVLEVRAQKVDPNKLVQGAGYAGEKLSLNFQNIEVRALLQVIADFTNFNVVTSDTVTGNVTLRLKDVPWDQALDIILQAKNLGLRKSGNVILIAPKDELNAKEKIELEAKQQIAALEPLRTQSFQLNYAKVAGHRQRHHRSEHGHGRIVGQRVADPLAARRRGVRDPHEPAVRHRHPVQARGSPGADRQDRHSRAPGPDRVAHRHRRRQLRPLARHSPRRRRPARHPRRHPGYNIGSNNYASPSAATSTRSPRRPLQSGTAGITFADTKFVNLPATGANGFDPATFALSLFGATANRFLNLEISALEADGKGKVVSSPRVITADQQKALIEQGEELPYQVATSSGATSLQFRKANLKLEVTPQVTPEGNVILDVDITKDSVGRATTAGFAINTKHVKTQVLVENGGTVVIGGIFEQNDREDVTKVPWLGDVPYLGNLFKTRTMTTSKTELLIFLTPKIVTDRTAAR